MLSALIVEFDPLVLGGLALASETLAGRLEKYGVPDNDPFRFVRKIYGKPFAEALTELLPQGIDEAHVERRLAATYTAVLQQYAQGVLPEIRAMLKPLGRAGIRIAVITRLRPDVVREICEGVKGEVIPVFDPLPLAVGLNPETLQAAIVSLGVPTRSCLGLFACGVSVRSAVRVGLRAVVVPDPMVAFENCAGADTVAQRLDKTLLSNLRARFREVKEADSALKK